MFYCQRFWRLGLIMAASLFLPLLSMEAALNESISDEAFPDTMVRMLYGFPHLLHSHQEKWMKANRELTVTVPGRLVTGVKDFSCQIGEEFMKRPADSVHSLTPGDIEVIGAMGDSLTAGLGAGAQKFAEMVNEYRGLAFSIGGDGDLKFSVTLPNVFRQFNSELTGASHRVGPIWNKLFSQLNVAISGARARDLLRQAQELVRRIKQSVKDQEQKWKFVTIFIGSNDLCKYCLVNKKFSDRDAKKYQDDIKKSIVYLKKNLPRTFVNLVSNINVQVLRETHRISAFCRTLHRASCPCIASVDTKQFDATMRQVHRVTRETGQMKEFLESDNFTVVVNTALEMAALPLDKMGEVDLAYFAPDCFHFSHPLHAGVAKLLWNNLFEPFGDKSTTYDRTKPAEIPLKCPDKLCPYLRTRFNTLDCKFFQSAATNLDQRQQFIRNALNARPVAAKLQRNSLFPVAQKVKPAFSVKSAKVEKSFTSRETLMGKRSVVVPSRDQQGRGGANFGLLLTGTLALVAAGFVAFVTVDALKTRKRNKESTERTPLLYLDDERMKAF